VQQSGGSYTAEAPMNWQKMLNVCRLLLMEALLVLQSVMIICASSLLEHHRNQPNNTNISHAIVSLFRIHVLSFLFILLHSFSGFL